MKKLTPLFLSAAALVALSPEVADAATNEQTLDAAADNTGGPAETPTGNVAKVRAGGESSSDVVTDVKPVITDDQITEVEERQEQDVTAPVLDESTIDVDQVYHTPVQVSEKDKKDQTEEAKRQYEYTPGGDVITDRDKNKVQVRFTVNDQNQLVNKLGTGEKDDRKTLGNIQTTGNAANTALGAENFKLVNRNTFGPQTIQLNNFDGSGLFTSYNVTENRLEDGTYDYVFDLAFRIPNNSISTVYDLVGTFIDVNNNRAERVISAINVVHEEALVEIRDERTHPNVEEYQPKKDVVVPFQRVSKYIPYDEDVVIATKTIKANGNDYVRGDVIHRDDIASAQETGHTKTYNLNLGERITIQNGVNGSRTIFYKQEFVDGQEATGVIEDPFAEFDQQGRTGKDGFQADVDPTHQIDLIGSVITNVDRVSGDDRFKNAVQLSRHGWNADNDENKARLESEWGAYGSHVFIANADKYADSLTGTPLAAANGAPILLTRGNTLRGEVADELARLYDLFRGLEPEGTFGVTVLGGVNSISEDVATAISTALFKDNNADTYEIGRIGGIDRYHQAYLVAEELERINRTEQAKEAPAKDDNTFPTAADFTADFDNIYIASGDVFSDALAIAAQAGEYRNPVLLTRGNTLNEYARKFLETYISDDSVAAVHESGVAIVGGTATISQAVANQINGILADKLAAGARADGEQEIAGGKVNRAYYTNPLDSTPKPVTVGRIAGANRYEVSRNVNKGAKYTQNESNVNFSKQEEGAYTHYIVVSGDHPSDALPASALANQIGAGVLLVSNNTQRAREQLIAAIENGVTDFTFIGGVNTLSEDTFNIFNYTGDTIRAIIEGPAEFSNVITDGPLSGLLGGDQPV